MVTTASLIIHYKMDLLTTIAINDLQAQNCPHDLYVLDCGSPEPYVTDTAKILRLAESRGLAGSINWAMEHMDNYEYVWHYTNDVTCTPEVLGTLVARLEHDQLLAAVQPSMPSYHSHLTPRSASTCEYVNYLEWAAVLVRMSAWREVGVLDVGFNFFSMDIDWSHRAKLAGWQVGVDYTVQCGHAWRGTHNATKFNISEQAKREHTYGVTKYGRQDWQQWLMTGGGV